MSIEIIPLDYRVIDGDSIRAVRPELHQKAEDFYAAELSAKFDPTKHNKVWIALRDGEVIGSAGYVMRPDISMFRAVGPHAAKATKLLMERLHSFFADQGLRGQEVFLYLSSKDTPEQRCPKWEQSMIAAKAIPADRYLVEVR